MRVSWPAGLGVAVLALLSYFVFPGHTYLQADTQVYLPILKRLADPSLFEKEMLARYPHVAFTIYDETAVGLHRLTGIEFRELLAGAQILFRACGILGVYLMAAAMGLDAAGALLVAGAFTLGATILGPAVLTFEYEPVPRGFSVGLLFLAMGLLANGRYLGAGIAGAIGMLYHVPAAYPFWAVYLVFAVSRKRWIGLAPLGVGLAILFVLARFQAGQGEPQHFFQRVDPGWEAMQRLRSQYNWVSLWKPEFFVHQLILWLAGLAAFWRLRSRIGEDLRFLVIGLPAIGMFSIGVSWLLLEQMKWALGPQLQPARALLYVSAFAVILGAAAGLEAAGKRQWPEALLWFALVYAVPSTTQTLDVAFTARGTVVFAAAAIAVGCAAMLPRWRVAAVPAMIVPFFLIRYAGHVVNYPPLHHAELDALSAWARQTTPKDAVFLFPDAGRQLYQGVFRVEAERALYVDWKAGGQINFLRAYSDVWWKRWQETFGRPKWEDSGAYYAGLGINYVVLQSNHRLQGGTAVYENARYRVYRVDGP